MDWRNVKGAVVFHSDGTITEYIPENGKTLTLKEAQELVDGFIEVVRLPAEHILIVNEEGKINELPYNERATVVAKGLWAIYPSDYIAGDAVLCPSDMLP